MQYNCDVMIHKKVSANDRVNGDFLIPSIDFVPDCAKYKSHNLKTSSPLYFSKEIIFRPHKKFRICLLFSYMKRKDYKIQFIYYEKCIFTCYLLWVGNLVSRRLKAFENRELASACAPKRTDENCIIVIVIICMLQKIRVIKSRRMKWAWHGRG